MIKLERKKKVFERMSEVLTRNYLNIRKQWMQQKHKGDYFVITANKKGSEIISFPSFEEAEKAYYEKYLSNSKSNIVLTHIHEPAFDQISMAYSNYVLAMHAFFDDYRILLSKKIVQCLKEKSYLKFIKYFNCYNSNVKCHVENLCMEVNAIESYSNDPTFTSYSQIAKWLKEIKDRLSLWKKETMDFLDVLTVEIKGSVLIEWLVSNRMKKMTKAVLDGQKPLSKKKGNK